MENKASDICACLCLNLSNKRFVLTTLAFCQPMFIKSKKKVNTKYSNKEPTSKKTWCVFTKFRKNFLRSFLKTCRKVD